MRITEQKSQLKRHPRVVWVVWVGRYRPRKLFVAGHQLVDGRRQRQVLPRPLVELLQTVGGGIGEHPAEDRFALPHHDGVGMTGGLARQHRWVHAAHDHRDAFGAIGRCDPVGAGSVGRPGGHRHQIGRCVEVELFGVLVDHGGVPALAAGERLDGHRRQRGEPVQRHMVQPHRTPAGLDHGDVRSIAASSYCAHEVLSPSSGTPGGRVRVPARIETRFVSPGTTGRVDGLGSVRSTGRNSAPSRGRR